MNPAHTNAPPLDLSAVRARLAGARGQQYWRSLEEVAETKEFQDLLQREFPASASEWGDEFSRRGFLKLMAASLALAGLNGCTKQPTEKILPYVVQPEGMVLGQPLYYASAMLFQGFAHGVLVKNREGHPIKLDGNPEHPSTLGASTVWMQASILDLYDPDRAFGVARAGEINTWAQFLSDLNDTLREQNSRKGAGLRFLTETVTSPTLAAQLKELLQKFPGAKWHQYEAVSRDQVREGARLAFGEIVETQHRFNKAAVILSLDSDFLYTHPERLRYTREFARGRQLSADQKEMNRLYVVESTPTVTGSMADHRLPLRSDEIANVAFLIAQQIGAPVESAAKASSEAQAAWISTLVRELQQHCGSSLVIAGEQQSPEVHALAHLINQTLGNVGQTVFHTASAEANPVNQLESLRQLVTDMKAGAVDTLFILGGNPVYDAPADFEFAQHLQKVKRSIHLGLHLDETSTLCEWHLPQAHYLESWSDARSFDGTVTIIQPLISPLYDGKSAHTLLAAMVRQQPIRSDYEVVSSYWRNQNLWPDFEKGWRRALHDGMISDSAQPTREVQVKAGVLSPTSRPEQPKPVAPTDLEILFRPDPNIWDGRHANNAWLQELPKPLNKLCWDNAALISPALAEQFKLNTGDLVELRLGDRVMRVPVWIMPGQADQSITLTLGYGRTRAGQIGTDVGFNAYPLRTSTALWTGANAKLSKVLGTHKLATTQIQHNVQSPERQIYRGGTLQEFLKNPDFVSEESERPPKQETLYNPGEFKYEGYKWGMQINLTTCIGCNACVTACQAENNIPVVGKSQVARGRDMLWIRIDTYYKGNVDHPGFVHMPVPCMHCEQAPCELVCPVEATLHDSEGLNLQVYNRCIGTRYCSNNCPYKVRRFNFLQYTNYQLPNLKPMYNPEVTVRWRGVMEKCTYCVQRISAARIRAKEEDRPIRDGEVKTACQQACPAEAIIFGDLNDPNSRVSKLKKHPLDYSMLGNLNTRPRTTYLAELENPNPELASPTA